jgi:hypothetical protein
MLYPWAQPSIFLLISTVSLIILSFIFGI